MARPIGRKNPTEPIENPASGADHAWKMFDVVSQLVRAAEVKSSAVLAANGVAATALYNIAKDSGEQSTLDTFFVVLTVTMLLGSSLCVAMSLIPRLWVRGTPENLIYFNHVARRYSRCEDFLTAFGKVIVDERELVRQIGAQIWANTRIARRKFLWGTWALILLFIGLASLAASIIVIHF